MDVLSIIMAVVGCLLAVLTFFVGRQSASKQDGQETGQILTELGYLKSNTDEIKNRLDKQDERHLTIMMRLTEVEALTKQAHKRLDNIESNMKKEN